MKIGKYVTNLGILSAIAGAYGVSKQAKSMPHDWRRTVLWAVWILGVVLAVASVAKDNEDAVS